MQVAVRIGNDKGEAAVIKALVAGKAKSLSGVVVKFGRIVKCINIAIYFIGEISVGGFQAALALIQPRRHTAKRECTILGAPCVADNAVDLRGNQKGDPTNPTPAAPSTIFVRDAKIQPVVPKITSAIAQVAAQSSGVEVFYHEPADLAIIPFAWNGQRRLLAIRHQLCQEGGGSPHWPLMKGEVHASWPVRVAAGVKAILNGLAHEGFVIAVILAIEHLRIQSLLDRGWSDVGPNPTPFLAVICFH